MTEYTPPGRFDELYERAEAIADRHSKKRFNEAFRRAEELKSGKWKPPLQTVEACVSVMNQWMNWLAPDIATQYQYKIREKDGGYEVYQDKESSR